MRTKLLICIGLLGALPLLGSDWPKYCANLELTGVAPSGGWISPTTAGSLSVRWIAHLRGPIASSPAVASGVVYVGDWSGREYALAINDGHLIASADLGTTTAPQCDPSTLGITSSPAISHGTVFVAGGDDSFYALDASTLEISWKKALGNTAQGYYGWSSPAVSGGRVIQGVSSNCDDPFVAGRVVALDTASGNTIEDEYLVQPEWPYDSTGSGVWTSPAVDLNRAAIFVTTGSALDVHDGRSYSIVRLPLQGFRVVDEWQIDTDGTEDSDWGSSPTLFHDGNGRMLVGAGQKDGRYYAFDRDDLAAGPVWKTSLAVGGPCPLCGDGTLSTAAFDGHRLYVGSGKRAGASALGSVVALDPTTGNVLWRHAVQAPVIAPISYANGVVFTTAGKHGIALDAATGELLWDFGTKAMCVGGIAITDEGIFFGDFSGTLYAFAVPQLTRLRAARPSR